MSSHVRFFSSFVVLKRLHLQACDKKECIGALFQFLDIIMSRFLNEIIVQLATWSIGITNIDEYISQKHGFILLSHAMIFSVGEIAPRADFVRCGGEFVIYEVWGAISVFREGDFCRLKYIQMLNWFQKNNSCYFGIKALMQFDSMVHNINKGYKTHIWSRINQTAVAWFCETLHCTNYPIPLRWSQAMRFSRR